MSRWVFSNIRGRKSYSGRISKALVLIVITLMFFPMCMIVTAPASADNTDSAQDTYVLGAYCEYWEGRCVFYSDTTSFTDPCFGNDEGDFDVEDMDGARQFALNIMDWLGRGGRNILIDQNHYQLYEQEGAWYSIKEFVDFLDSAGYYIEFYDNSATELSYEQLRNYDLLLLLGTRYTNDPGDFISQYGFSNTEIQDIIKYVTMGGGLFVLGGGDREAGDDTELSDGIYNPLISEFGVSFKGNIPDIDFYRPNSWNCDVSLSEHELTKDIANLPQDEYMRWLSLEEPSKPLVHLNKQSSIKLSHFIHVTEGGVISACVKYDEGRAVFCGTSTPFLYYSPDGHHHNSPEQVSGAENFSLNICFWLGRGGKKILIDQLHNQPEPRDDGSGISGFEELVKSDGYTVIYNFETIFDPELSFEMLEKFDILILMRLKSSRSHSGSLYRWSYSEREIENITRFVEQGGGLLVMITSQDFDQSASNSIYNQISNKFGVTFNNNSLSYDIEYDWQVTKHPLTVNVSKLPLTTSCTLSVEDNATSIISVREAEEDNGFGDVLSYGRFFLIISIILIAILFGLIRVVGTEIGKYKLFAALAPMYSKLKKDKLLDNETRGLICEHIQEHPGTHYNELRRKLNLPNGALAYHLKTLENEGYITSKRDGMYKMLYPADLKLSQVEPYMSKSRKEIFEIINKNPGLSQKAITAKVDLTLSTVNYHINCMAEIGLVRLERDGNEMRCYPMKEAS